MASKAGEILEYIAGAYLAAFGIVYILLILSATYGLISIPSDILLSLAGLFLVLMVVAPIAAIAGIVGWYIDRENRKASAVFAVGSSLAFLPMIVNMFLAQITISELILTLIVLVPLGAAFTVSVYSLSTAKPAKPMHLSGDVLERRALRRIMHEVGWTYGERRLRRALREE